MFVLIPIKAIQDIYVKWWIFRIYGQKLKRAGFGPGTFFGDYRVAISLVNKSLSFFKWLRPGKKFVGLLLLCKVLNSKLLVFFLNLQTVKHECQKSSNL